MALKVSLTIPAYSPDEQEVVYPESYARIHYVRSMAQESFIFVCWYVNEEARINEQPPIKVYEYKADTAALTGDIYPAAYAYLKSLPEFTGAVDC